MLASHKQPCDNPSHVIVLTLSTARRILLRRFQGILRLFSSPEVSSLVCGAYKKEALFLNQEKQPALDLYRFLTRY